jgi:peroxiredoxin
MFVDVMLVIIVVSLCVGLYQVVKQQGRILLRLDAIEKQREKADQTPEPTGLPAGTAFPSFSIPDLTGKIVRLEDFRGKQALLIHWSPDCGFCEMIAPDLARLQVDLSKHDIQAVLLAHGAAEANRKLAGEYGLSYPILLLNDSQPPEPFQNMGTPVAYLLDREGRVAQPLAVGFEEITALARNAISAVPLPGARPLSESRIERDGLKAGSPAPLFRLPDLEGRTVSLDDYRGRRVLLVFSDPHCGPCDEVAPQLARLHREHRNNGLDFVMIGRGSPAENLRKVEQFGIQFPVVLQNKWKLSKEYGIFATPVAFLVGGDGVILRDVAVGSDAITALAVEGLGEGKDRQSALSS